MNDRPLPPRPDPDAHELAASAWIDEMATPEEGALVRDHTETSRLAARMREVATEVARVDPAAPDTVERAIGAALAAFDRGPASAATPSAARSRRAGWFRPAMAAAAAVLLIGVAGVVVVNGIQGGTGDDAAEAPASLVDASTFDDADETSEIAADDAADGGADVRASASEPGPEAASDAASDRDDADAYRPDGEPAGNTESETVGDADPVVDVDLTGPDMLAEWVALRLDADPNAADPDPNAERSPCPRPTDLEHERVLGRTWYTGIEVIVVSDGRTAVGLEPVSCDEVVRATLRE